MGWAEKLPSGSWRALYRDRSGKRRSAGTFPHKKAAENAATIAEDAARKVGWRDPNAGAMLWGDWFDAWWPTRGVEAGTAARDLGRFKKHILPEWSDVPLADITRHDVKAWATSLGADVSPATVKRILSNFSGSLAAAVDAEKLRDNPASRIPIAAGETDEMRFLTLNEYAALDHAFQNPYDRALAALLVGTGARWGEGVGIHLPRLDIRRGALRIAETWDDAMGRVKPWPKGRRIRTVPVPDWTIELLEPIIGDRTAGLLFDRGNGRPPISSNWRQRVWLPALERAEIGHLRIHDLRHTYASWLIQDGVPLARVGKLMGHVSPVTTQRYAHLVDEDMTGILRALPRPTRGADVGQPAAPVRITSIAPTKRGTSKSRGA
jgi:integrase